MEPQTQNVFEEVSRSNMVTEWAASAGRAQMSSDRKTKGRWGYSSGFIGEGLVFVAHNTKEPLTPAPFSYQRPINSSRPPWVPVEMWRRRKSCWGRGECDSEMVTLLTDFILSLSGFFFFFFNLRSALATAHEQPKFYWSMLRPMWVFGPISRLWCIT